jgi:hypothetical protein
MTRPLNPKKENKAPLKTKDKLQQCQSLKLMPKRTIREQMMLRQQ